MNLGMKNNYKTVRHVLTVVFLLCMASSHQAMAAALDLATIPLANSPTVTIQPNLLFVLDDSGSMDWGYMPDWANDSLCKNSSGTYSSSCTDEPPYRSKDFNAIYYNPEVTYQPAVNADGTSKGSQTTWTSVKNDAYGVQSTGSTNLVTSYTDVEWCTSTAYTDCLRNDNYILPGTVNGKLYKYLHSNVKATGTGLVATGSPFAPTTVSRSYGPHYYNIIPGEYCDSAQLTNCQFTQTATFKYPAKVRWCKATTNPTATADANATAATPPAGACQAARVGTFNVPRYPTKFFVPAVAGVPAIPEVLYQAPVKPSNGSLKITAVNKSKSVSIKCGSTYIGQSGTFTSSNSNTASTRLDTLYTSINTTVNGYTISCSKGGSPTTSLTCSVSAPAGASACPGGFTVASDITVTTNTGPQGGANEVPYSPGVPAVPAQDAYYPGGFQRVDIVSGGSYTKAASRTDCAGSTCTYNEEMTNFANWWTYYHTRMQSMKTAASLAFKDIGEDFRVGFMTIHATGSSAALNIATFNTTQKSAWYTKFFSINPNSATPLRSALAKAGRIFAKKETIGGVFSDPMEYPCQQNFTLMTTDGYWNTDVESDVMGVGGSQVGDKDGGTTARPMYEGPTATTNSLADVAKYYRDTDIRNATFSNCTGALNLDVCQDPSPATTNQKQSMVTMTLGLGVDGTLTYSKDYKSATSGDYFDIKNGTKNWPDPIANTEGERIDDLWHAAVNGEGSYFSAKNPTDLVNSLKEALASVKVKVGAGAAAATSTLNPITGDNFAYVASYTTGHWTGNLEKREINVTTGEVGIAAAACVEDVLPLSSCSSPSTIEADGAGGYNCVTTGVTNPASCSGTLDGTSCKVKVAVACNGTLKSKVGSSSDTRNIYMSNGNSLTNFSYSNLTSAQKATFASTFLAANLSQWSALTTNQRANVTGSNLVNYLRGQTGYDENADDFDKRVFRARQAVMGDVIDSKPAFIGTPTFSYTDPGYAAFKTAQASRAKTVYIGSNDGMLHAFDATTLEERWAYVPSMVIANMWKLADTGYASKHAYYADGEPIISDICVLDCDKASASWKTILVAGLNGGGRGYYALDITNPLSPSLLWEFDANKEHNLGYTFGNPVITKRSSDGKWVVLVTSGYNNIPDNSSFYALTSTKFKPNNPALYTTGDGVGYLYVLEASSGNELNQISTGAGSSATPSGLAKIRAYADDAEKNNTATYVYGGDLLGNLWRFNIADNSVIKFATLEVSGVAQPITTAPELGFVNNTKVVFVGTGKYLELADLTDKSQQTIYAIKDDSRSTVLSNPRGSTTMVKQTVVASGDTRVSGSSNVVDFSSGNGWYVDLPDAGERQNISAQLVLGTLLVPTTVPTSSVCQPAGYGWFNYLDYKTGSAVPNTTGSTIVSNRTSSPSVGFNVVYVDGKPKVSNVTADNPTPQLLSGAPFAGSGSGFQNKRTIWRELVN